MDINEKRKQIREIIGTHVDDSCLFPDRSCNALCGGYCASTKEAYKCLMERLTQIGMVIKVDRELPENPLDKAQLADASRRIYRLGNFTFDDIYRQAYDDGFKKKQSDMAGYTAVEPLIEENK